MASTLRAATELARKVRKPPPVVLGGGFFFVTLRFVADQSLSRWPAAAGAHLLPLEDPKPVAADLDFKAGVKAPAWLALHDLLGVGGMGKVYRATDRRSGDIVAVKTLTNFVGKELLCRKNEFRSFADVVHPNLISQHERVEHEGHWFLLMELLEGRELLYDLRDQAPPQRLYAPNSSGSGGSSSGNALGSNKIDANNPQGTSPAVELGLSGHSEPGQARTTLVVGRVEERKKLRALAAQARRAPASIFIRGRSGVGKTVLLGELLTGAVGKAGRASRARHWRVPR